MSARRAARLAVVAFLVTLGVLATGSTGEAGAQTARPGSDRSTVLAIDPAEAAGVVRARIAGGDQAVVLEVLPGHEIVVFGYQHEPFLRVRADGTAEVNRSSPTAAANDTVDGVTAAPGATGDPGWAQIGRTGQVHWHDHRIHWMAPDVPPTTDPGGRILDWHIDLQVDGAPVQLRGTLVREPAANPLPFLVLTGVLATVAVVAGRRRPLDAAIAAVTVATGAAAVGIVSTGLAERPAGGFDALLMTTVVLAVGGTTTAWTTRRRRPRASAAATIAACGGVVGYLTVGVRTWWQPVLVTNWPAPIERGLVAIAVGGVLAAAFLAVHASADAPVSARADAVPEP